MRKPMQEKSLLSHNLLIDPSSCMFRPFLLAATSWFTVSLQSNGFMLTRWMELILFLIEVCGILFVYLGFILVLCMDAQMRCERSI